MKEIKLVIILVVFSATAVYGQAKKISLEETNKKLNTELNSKNQIITFKSDSITELKKQILYFKETLALLNSTISAENKEVSFKINSVMGSSKTGKITIEGLLVNRGILRSIQGQKAVATDPKGNGTITYNMTVGNTIRIEKLLENVPTKFTLELEKLPVNIPVIKSLIIDFYSTVAFKSDPLNVVFQNLEVNWSK